MIKRKGKHSNICLKVSDKLILFLSLSTYIIVSYILMNTSAIIYKFRFINSIAISAFLLFVVITIFSFILIYDKKYKYSFSYIIAMLPSFAFFLIFINFDTFFESTIISYIWFTFQLYLLKKNNFSLKELYFYGLIIFLLIFINPVFIFLLLSVYITISFLDILDFKKIITPFISALTLAIIILTIDYAFLDFQIYHYFLSSKPQLSSASLSLPLLAFTIFSLVTCIMIYPWMQRQLVYKRRQIWVSIVQILFCIIIAFTLPLDNFKIVLLIYVWLLTLNIQKILIAEDLTWRKIIYQLFVILISEFWIFSCDFLNLF